METWDRMMGRLSGLQRQVRPAPKRQQRRWLWFGIGAACGVAGAGLMFILDPQAGRRRRAIAKDRGAGMTRRAARRSSHLGKRARAEARGQYAHLRHLRRSSDPAANDAALADRVRSQLPRDPDLHHHTLNINAENGVVVLRGVVDRPDQIDTLVKATERVPGVTRVESYLHLPGTTAPNKQAALAHETEQDIAPPASIIELDSAATGV